MDYKEQWTEYFEEALEAGLDEDKAFEWATNFIGDNYAEAIDRAMERDNESR